jgi:hypothetical protein
MDQNQHLQLKIRPKVMVQHHMEVQLMGWFQHSIINNFFKIALTEDEEFFMSKFITTIHK